MIDVSLQKKMISSKIRFCHSIYLSLNYGPELIHGECTILTMSLSLIGEAASLKHANTSYGAFAIASTVFAASNKIRLRYSEDRCEKSQGVHI